MGVEFAGRGGKMFEGEPGVLAQKLPECFSMMGRGVVQQDNDAVAQMPQELAQEHTDLLLPDVV
jgi:hypothetical protein